MNNFEENMMLYEQLNDLGDKYNIIFEELDRLHVKLYTSTNHIGIMQKIDKLCIERLDVIELMHNLSIKLGLDTTTKLGQYIPPNLRKNTDFYLKYN